MKANLKPRLPLISIAILASGLLFAASVYAEPGASMSHIPYLWVLGVAVAFLLSWLVVYVLVRLGLQGTPLKRWIVRIILLVFFLVTVAPLIVAFGSILITGRTM